MRTKMGGKLCLRQAAAQAPRPAKAATLVLDVRHLAAATFGDHSLARELLSLFLHYSESVLSRMEIADRAALASLAHGLKGAARGIGAWEVAEAAEVVETARAAEGRPLVTDMARLRQAVAEAQVAIKAALETARGAVPAPVRHTPGACEGEPV